MTRLTRVFACITVAALLGGCMSTHPASPTQFGDNANMPSELSHVLRDYEKAWAAKDAAALAALFAHDGFVLSNARPPVRGREDIVKHYQGAGGPLVLRAMAWRTQRDVGWIIGEYDQDLSFANPGKFTLTLVRDHNRRWAIYSDMDNSNALPSHSQPPQPMQPAQAPPTTAPAGSSS